MYFQVKSQDQAGRRHLLSLEKQGDWTCQRKPGRSPAEVCSSWHQGRRPGRCGWSGQRIPGAGSSSTWRLPPWNSSPLQWVCCVSAGGAPVSRHLRNTVLVAKVNEGTFFAGCYLDNLYIWWRELKKQNKTNTTKHQKQSDIPGKSLAEGNKRSCIWTLSVRSSAASSGSSRASRIIWQASNAPRPITDDFTAQVYVLPKRSQISWKDSV